MLTIKTMYKIFIIIKLGLTSKTKTNHSTKEAPYLKSAFKKHKKIFISTMIKWVPKLYFKGLGSVIARLGNHLRQLVKLASQK